ncbi:4-hydroxybenzoate geranyltransferase 2-like [Carex rostrata]
MELLSTSTVTLPYARRHGNFNNAYFQNQPSLRRIHAQPLQQKFLPVLKPGLSLSPSLLRDKLFVCKGSERITWVDEKVPEIIRPYVKLARIDDDIALWLHAWPAFWSIMLATKPGTVPDFKLFGLFHLMALFVHVSCCASNDLFDLDYDRKVERSKTRPLAAGEITPVQGWLFWALNIALLIPLVLQLNKLCIVLAAVEQVLWIAYPLMKRITYWPQAFLGLAHNWGATLGWAAVMGNLTDIRIFIPVHIAGIFWTMLYDTIYAHQDKDDDAEAGVKSTALLFGDSTRTWLLGFATICIGSLMFAGYNAHMGWPFYLSMIPAFGHLLWQIYSVDLSNGFDCLMKFLSNKWFGAIVMAGMVLGRIVY